MFNWLSVLAVPVAIWWVIFSPLFLGRGPPNRLAAAILAAIERPVFAFFVALAMLGSMNGVQCEFEFLSDFDTILLSLPFSK